jgi:hypothetical protein
MLTSTEGRILYKLCLPKIKGTIWEDHIINKPKTKDELEREKEYEKICKRYDDFLK